MRMGENGSINCIPAHVYLSHTQCAKIPVAFEALYLSYFFGARRKLMYVNKVYLFYNQAA